MREVMEYGMSSGYFSGLLIVLCVTAFACGVLINLVDYRLEKAGVTDDEVYNKWYWRIPIACFIVSTIVTIIILQKEVEKND